MEKNGAVIEVRNATFEYSSGTPVFSDVSFMAQKGQIISILGQNGCGKTTLLKCILGLLVPVSGRISLGGSDPFLSDNAGTGYVSQHSEAVFPYTVMEMVLMGRAREVGIFSVPGSQDVVRAKEALGAMNIMSLSAKAYTEISFGERQLVRIARALASGSEILVLDEPTASLDFKNQYFLLDTIRRLSRERGCTVLFTTHHPEHALLVSDVTLGMANGGRTFFGPTNEIINEKNLEMIYGIPATIISHEHECGSIKSVIPTASLRSKALK